MIVFERDNLNKTISGFESINRYYDRTNERYTAKILPGEYYVSKTGEMITTVLGSCISACIRDKVLKIGGMNHYMLPIDRRAKPRDASFDISAASRFGDFAMEMLINSILREGGKRKNLEVKIFGGGHVVTQLHGSEIGNKNIEFVHEYLSYEGLDVIAEDTGDFYPRKVNYFTDTGRVRVKKLQTVNNSTISNREDNYYSKILENSEQSDDMELFE